jgi:[ribosomal protein S5]-alanine N-acetyltransferase
MQVVCYTILAPGVEFMRLNTSRLVLREYEINDWVVMRAYQRDSRYFQFYPWTDRSETEVRAFIQMYINYQSEKPRRKFQFAITLPPEGTLIGSCGIRRKNENEWEAEIGYELAPEHWGQGYATEAAKEIIRFGFQELHLHRISATCVAGNTSSARVLERVEMRLEGWLKENDYFKGRWWDTQVYAIIESEWRANTGKQTSGLT